MFQDYYTALYNLDAASPSVDAMLKLSCIEASLVSLGLLTFSPEHQAELEQPISPVEILSTVKSLPSGKSPGMDGFTKAYDLFLMQHQPFMCIYFNSLASVGRVPEGAFLAHVMVLPKERKDHTWPQNYRQISLLNTGLKIFAMILANWLKTASPTLEAL